MQAVLEERTPEKEFKEFVSRLLTTVNQGPIIVGVGDMVLGNNLIDRVAYIADQVEHHAL